MSHHRLRTTTWLTAASFALVGAIACGDSDSSTTDVATAPPETTLAPASEDGTPTTPATPPAIEPFEWPRSTPEQQGMSSALLAELVDDLATSPGIDSVTVVRHGHLVLDAVVYPMPADVAHHLYSCGKSVVGALAGLAIDREHLRGVDEPVVELLADAAPDVVDERMAAMTVEDLLTMTTGLDCRDSWRYDWAGMADVMATDEWTSNILQWSMLEEPGTRFEYCNSASYLLSAIITEVTGLTAAEFAEETLFGPLGIADYTWESSPEGISPGWGELWLRPAEFAKIGELVLRGGSWDGDQIISSEWVDEMTTPRFAAGPPYPADYAYQWYVDDDGTVYAAGYGGQYLIVSPDLDLVVVFTAGLARNDRPLDLMTELIGPAVVSDDALPEDAAATERLRAAVERAVEGPPPTPADLPAVADAIDGRRYELADNDLGIEAVEYRFEPGSSVAIEVVDTTGGTFLSEVGLDGRHRFDDETGLLARGSWRADGSFVQEWQALGAADRGWTQIETTGDDTITVRACDVVVGDCWTTTGTTTD